MFCVCILVLCFFIKILQTKKNVTCVFGIFYLLFIYIYIYIHGLVLIIYRCDWYNDSMDCDPPKCWKNGKCSKGFPKEYSEETILREDGYPLYKRLHKNNGGNIYIDDKSGSHYDDAWVVPYNPYMLYKYNCHLNMECTASIKAVKYVNKYINKGIDMSTINVMLNEDERELRDKFQFNEPMKYIRGRYVTSHSGLWRLFAWPLHEAYPSVVNIGVHLDGAQPVIYPIHAKSTRIFKEWEKQRRTPLTEYFQTVRNEYEKPLSKKKLNGGLPATELRFDEMPQYYEWKRETKRWIRRTNKTKCITRVYKVSLQDKEKFYMRRLLLHKKGVKNYADLRTVDNIKQTTFEKACVKLGIANNDTEYFDCMAESALHSSARALRDLFILILRDKLLSNESVLKMWELYRKDFSSDILHNYRKHRLNMDYCTEIYNIALYKIEKRLNDSNVSLTDYGIMKPVVPDSYKHVENSIWDKASLKKFVDARILSFQDNAEQKNFFDTCMRYIDKKIPKTIVCLAPAGTGKTYVSNTILAQARCNDNICYSVASSALAATLLDGGTTAHYRFDIPINGITDETTCLWKKTPKDLLKKCSVFIWDEFTMQHKKCFEIVDRSLRLLTGVDKLWGGKVMIITGDWRQILPVIKKGNEAQIVEATLMTSYIWKSATICTLSKNVRINNTKDNVFWSKYLLEIGNGTEKIYKKLGKEMIKIPENLISKQPQFEDFISDIWNDYNEHYHNGKYIRNRSIITPLNKDIEVINDIMLQKLPGDAVIFESVDSVLEGFGHGGLSEEMLHKFETSSIPRHTIKLKIHTPIMLMRNLDQENGLCNGTKLIVTQIKKYSIKAKIISKKHYGKEFIIPRIYMDSNTADFGFTLRRKQFPIRVCYCMTINKVQGQTCNKLGLYLPDPVFSHGQLYVALSRVKDPKDIDIFICDSKVHGHLIKNKQDMYTKNVVYKQILDIINQKIQLVN